jgi:hypothetical protein
MAKKNQRVLVDPAHKESKKRHAAVAAKKKERVLQSKIKDPAHKESFKRAKADWKKKNGSTGILNAFSPGPAFSSMTPKPKPKAKPKPQAKRKPVKRVGLTRKPKR